MRKVMVLCLSMMLLFSVSYAENSWSFNNDCNVWYFDSDYKAPILIPIEIDGTIYYSELLQAAVARAETCIDGCNLQLGNRCPEMDGWYRYSSTHHQYRTYYYATCVDCFTVSYVFTTGSTALHIWHHVNDYHYYDTFHAVVEHCNICNETMTSYVFCPGPDGGGCTVGANQAAEEVVTE